MSYIFLLNFNLCRCLSLIFFPVPRRNILIVYVAFTCNKIFFDCLYMYLWMCVCVYCIMQLSVIIAMFLILKIKKIHFIINNKRTNNQKWSFCSRIKFCRFVNWFDSKNQLFFYELIHSRYYSYSVYTINKRLLKFKLLMSLKKSLMVF